jgi:polyketide cyclase/dehydrase/lipid transport protein
MITMWSRTSRRRLPTDTHDRVRSRRPGRHLDDPNGLGLKPIQHPAIALARSARTRVLITLILAEPAAQRHIFSNQSAPAAYRMPKLCLCHHKTDRTPPAGPPSSMAYRARRAAEEQLVIVWTVIGQGVCTMWYMRYKQTIRAIADLDRAWAALTGVTTWPRWTKSISAVMPLDGTDVRPGNRFRIKQPGLPWMVWQVNDVRDGVYFTWEARSPGVRTVGTHELRHNPDGTTQITIGVEQSGLLSGLIGVLRGGRTRRFLEMEAAGLKAASEAATSHGAA